MRVVRRVEVCARGGRSWLRVEWPAGATLIRLARIALEPDVFVVAVVSGGVRVLRGQAAAEAWETARAAVEERVAGARTAGEPDA